jgi:uncharacterized protein HemY
MALELGLLYHGEQRFPEAVEQLERARRGRLVEADRKRCRIPLAESLAAVGRKREAIAVLQEVLKELRLGTERQTGARELILELGGRQP